MHYLRQISSLPARQGTALFWGLLIAASLVGGLIGLSPGAADVASQSERNHFAFERLSRPAPPQLQQSERVQTPMDAFILSRLEAAELTLSPPAARKTLLRRTHLDLIGLPPTLAEATTYFTDDSPGAYERLVDRLLASSHFGE